MGLSRPRTVLKARPDVFDSRPDALVARWNRDHDRGVNIAWRDERSQFGTGWTMGPAYIHDGLFAAVQVAGQLLPVPVHWVTFIDDATGVEDP